MARWIILAQIVAYLVLMPFLRAQGELGYHPPILIGVIAAFAFAAGAFGIALSRRSVTPSLDTTLALAPRSWLWIVVAILAAAYALLSVQFGLLNRRQGSEVMAEIFGTLPLWALAILRVYEIIFLPMIVIYMLSTADIKRSERITVGIIVLVSLPFMGLADSRGRLVIMALTIVMFITQGTFIKNFFNNLRFVFAGFLVTSTFFYFSAQRSSSFYSFSDYLQLDVFQRLDGLNIVTQLREAHLMSYFGQWDLMALSPLISRIPFLEAAQDAKISGRTSSKQYYIQDLLRSTRLDDSNSMVTDPLYMAGVMGLIVCFFALGYVCSRLDRFNATMPFSQSPVKIALALSFAISFVSFEGDFLNGIITTVQSFVMLVLLLHVGFHYRPAVPSGGGAERKEARPACA